MHNSSETRRNRKEYSFNRAKVLLCYCWRCCCCCCFCFFLFGFTLFNEDECDFYDVRVNKKYHITDFYPLLSISLLVCALYFQFTSHYYDMACNKCNFFSLLILCRFSLSLSLSFVLEIETEKNCINDETIYSAIMPVSSCQKGVLHMKIGLSEVTTPWKPTAHWRMSREKMRI